MRSESFLPAFMLSAAILAPACKPDAGEDSATDTAVTDPLATDSSSGEPSSGTDSSSLGPESTDTGDSVMGGVEGCAPPDPAAVAAIDVDFGAWPVLQGEPNAIRMFADCTVQAISNQAGEFGVEMLCSEDEQVDVAIRIAVTAPADFAFDIDVGAEVKMNSQWRDEDESLGTGVWFVLHQRGGGSPLLLAGLDGDSATAANEASVFTVDTLDGVCEPDMNGAERLSFVFDYEGDADLQLIDQSRGNATTGGRKYDTILHQAVANSCLDCKDDIVWLIGSVD